MLSVFFKKMQAVTANFFGILLKNLLLEEVLMRTSLCQANIRLLKVKNRNTRKRYEMCSKLTIKTLE